MMGKTADNERIRLRATFYNNLSVGCLVAGALVPYVALGRVLAELNRTGQIPYAEIRNFWHCHIWRCLSGFGILVDAKNCRQHHSGNPRLNISCMIGYGNSNVPQ